MKNGSSWLPSKRKRYGVIELYAEMNEKIADMLLECTDNGMLLYAGTYIKELEKQLIEYKQLEETGVILRLPIESKTKVYSLEYGCGLNESNKRGICFRGICSKCLDKKLYIHEATAEASCVIQELGRTVFFNRETAEKFLDNLQT